MGAVTMSRMYGAGGRTVSEMLAHELGYRLVDREIVEQAAARAGIDPEIAEQLDERTPSLIEDVGLALAAASPELGMVTAPLDDRVLARGIRKLIESLADAGGYVILGRGGQAILRDRPDVCHVQLTGEVSTRAVLIAERQGVTIKEARELCRRVDSDRAGFVRRFYDVDISDPLLYDAILNTSRLGMDAAASVALEVVRRRIGG